MSFFNKEKSGNGSPTAQQSGSTRVMHAATATAVANVSRPPATANSAGQTTSRVSNGLKEFLSQLSGIGRGHLLDLGPARQTTLNFFIERGFKVYTDDLLMTWKIFLEAEEQRKKDLAPDADRSDITPAARAERFLESTLQYPEGTFDGVLMWDTLDYVDNDLMTRLAAKLTSLVRDGGAVLAVFHARKPETFHRFRILDAQNLELIPAPSPFPPQRVLQNREIANLFSRYRTSKTFVGRDQLREGLFVK